MADPGAPTTTSSSNLNLAGARAVLDAALAKATEMGMAFCIAVADASGELILSARMDGAPRLSVGIAANKAYSVTGFSGLPTSAWWDLIKDEPALVNGLTHTPRLTIFGGGVGIFVGDELVGAVGVSGGTADQDAEVAEAAAAVIG